MYNDTLNGSTEKRSAELPDAVGPIVQLQEKLYVPVKEYPDVSTNICSESDFLIMWQPLILYFSSYLLPYMVSRV